MRRSGVDSGKVRDMANLRDQFAPYYTPGQEAVATAVRTGLVTPDTNVLLAAYRFERQAREELFSAFDKLGGRLWIPHQVALEFHRNRLGVIAQQDASFGKTRDELETAIGSYLAKLRAFTNRIAIQPRSQELEQMIRDAHAHVTAQVNSAEEANDVHLDSRDSDEVLARLETLFEGRVGDPMKPDQLDAARKEAKRRVDQAIPPGYKDKDKADSSGDYLVWRQLLQEASTRQLPVILITDDHKEDWVRREHGLTLGPRPELCEEMSAEAGVSFHLMSTLTFLRHAKEYLHVSVSPETVEQARELPARLYDHNRAVYKEIRRDAQIAEIVAQIQELHHQISYATAELRNLNEMLDNGYDPRTGVLVDGAVRESVLNQRSIAQRILDTFNDELERLTVILATLAEEHNSPEAR